MTKTLRHYPENPNDIDILLFDDLHLNLTKITTALESVGYRQYTKGNNFYNFGRIGKVGFWDYKRVGPASSSTDSFDWFDLDIYGEIMVEEFVHGDKTLLANDVVAETFLSVVDGIALEAKVLSPGANLFYVYFHSIFPTRSVGLEVFLTTLHELLHFQSRDYQRFAELARRSRLQKEVAYVLRLMGDLYVDVYGTVCERLQFLSWSLSERPPEMEVGEINFPYIFQTSLFLSAGMKCALHRKGFQSLLAVLVKSLYPPYALNILREVFSRRLAEQRYAPKYGSL